MELIKLTPDEFSRIAKLIYDRTGIHLPDSKLTLLSNRLRRRVRALNLETFKDYYELLSDAARCEEELPHFLSAVTTNETYFFRNENLWKMFREKWLPGIVEKNKGKTGKSIRIWSAASSTGEEAHTAAICLREGLPDCASWRIRILGTDISQRVLDSASAAKYNDYAVGKMPKASLKKWFEQRDGSYFLHAEIRKMVSFKFHNLRDPLGDGNYDLVFLRNVLMYFDNAMKLRVLENVTNALVPGGHLVVGDVDPIRNTPELNKALRVKYLGPNLYQKPKAAAAMTAATTKG